MGESAVIRYTLTRAVIIYNNIRNRVQIWDVEQSVEVHRRWLRVPRKPKCSSSAYSGKSRPISSSTQ